MKVKVNDIDNKVVKEISLEKFIFGIPYKQEIIYRMIRFQNAKKQSGNHKTKGISEISGTTKKPFKQKGTGSARQGSKRSPQMRGGAVIFGPQVRTHSHKLPKKIRSLALRSVLSRKYSEGKLKILSDIKLQKPKTSNLKDKLSKFGMESALFIGGEKIDEKFLFASRNIPNIDVMTFHGLNVYTIVKRDFLVISEDALLSINKRFVK